MLTDKKIANAKPRAKLYRLSDGAGLYLEVSTAGGKLWRFRYRYGGKEKMLALGKYPEVRGPEARKRAGSARQAVSEGRDPAAEKQAAKERERIAADSSFEAVARLQRLKGDLKNLWSLRVSGNWRVTFVFEDGDAEIVNLEDYH